MFNRIYSFFETLINISPKSLIAQGVLFILFGITTFLFVGYILKFRLIQKYIAVLKNNLAQQEELREQEFQELILSNGEQETIPFLRRIDIFLEQSGAKYKIPGLTAEVYLTFMISVSIIMFVIGTVFLHSYIYGALSSILIVLLNYIHLYMRRNQNLKQTDRDIMKFINLLENVNYSETRLDKIFRRVIPYLKNPLRDALDRFCVEVSSGISVECALDNLCDRVEHKKLKNLFKSFKICNSKEQNYAEIIEENREVIRDYIAAKKEREIIKKNALIELCIIAVMGIFLLFLFQTMITNMFGLIFETLPGQIIVAYMVVVLFIGIITALKVER